MIQPVHPVGWPLLSAPTAIYALCRSVGWISGRWWAYWFSGIRLPIAPALGRPLSETATAPALQHGHSPVRGEAPAVKRWQPWPAHPPFADEVTRWWPSDDWPPAEPPLVIEDILPDLPPEIIDWRARGGLLDFWA